MNKILILLTVSMLSLFGATFNVSDTPELRTALETAATNGEDDTIILADGTYKTTDDGGGTFIYLSNEANSLTLQGSSSENVILSGDSVEQILNHQSTEDAPMTLEKLSFVDGNNTSTSTPENYGGGVYADYYLKVADCNFSNNTAQVGGGFYSTSIHYTTYTTVNNTIFSNNYSYLDGGGFYSFSNINVNNSIFTNNVANSLGGGFSAGNYYSFDVNVDNSTFNDNIAGSNGGGFYSKNISLANSIFTNNTAYNDGGGFYSSIHVFAIIKNSIFTNNTAYNDGGGFYSAYSLSGKYLDTHLVTNSIFQNNNANNGGAFNSGGLIKIINSLISNNISGIYIQNNEDSIVLNNIFLDNSSSDISANSDVIISRLDNNYLDTSKVTVSNFKKNNIFDGVNLGFIDEANGDYNLTVFSDLIDAGATTIDGLTLPATDLNGNARIAGATIDIGPYEFSSTKPTINSFTYTGTAKELSQLTFSVDYTLADDGRTLSNITYDYSNDGSWSAVDTHTFDTAGTYTVNVKVTDSEGEHSTSSLQVTIAEIGLQDKLLTYLTQDQIDSILPFVESDKTSAVTNASTTALENGKSYVLNNLDEFDLTTITAMNTSVSDANTSGYNLGLSAKETQILATPSAYGLVSTSDLNSSVSDAIANGITQGKQYVQDNLSEFDLTTITAMNTSVSDAILQEQLKILANPEAYGVSTTPTMVKQTISAKSGWQMVGALSDINNTSVFNDSCIDIIWQYKNGLWKALSPDSELQSTISNLGYGGISSILKSEAFWLHAHSECDVDTFIDNSPISSITGANSLYHTSETLSLDGSSSSDDGSIVSYSWELDGSEVSTESTYSNSSLASSTHTITLSVTDDYNQTSSSSHTFKVTSSFTDLLPMNEVGSMKSTSKSCINSDCTIQLGTGSQLYFKVTNDTNREFVITKMEIISYYNEASTIRASSTDSSLLGGSTFTENESVNLGYSLTSSQTANYWVGTYYLTDKATGETFTNSMTWNGTSY